MAKVREMVMFTLMPMSSAAPLSSATTRMALPIFVLPVNRVSPTMMMMFISTVTMVSPLMSSCPSKKEREPRLTTEGKLLGLEPQSSSATFCSR